MSKIKEFLRLLLARILYHFPPKMAHEILYFFSMKEKLDLENPKDLNQKIQWLILNEYGEKETELADKLLVRDYVKNKGYENILTKIYKVYKSVDEINLEDLPDSFVLKTNHGSGDIQICYDKNNFNLKKSKKCLKKSLNTNYAKKSLEYHYSKIKPCIICEELLSADDKIKKLPFDYKIYCFDGKANCVLVCSNREKKMNLDYYDLNWNYLDYSKPEYRSNELISKPECFDEMVKIAEDLTKGFKFVRCDFYEINNKIYFGEMTFTPSAGLLKRNTKKSLIELGKLIDIK